MRAFGGQDAAAAALALAALVWLVARRVRPRKGAGCGDCPGCAIGGRAPSPGAVPRASAPGAGSTFIPVSELTRRER